MSDVKTPPRKLVDLNPAWVETYGTGEIYGIGYDCPCGLPVFDPVYENGKVKVGTDGKVVGAVPYDQCCPRGGREVVPTKGNFIGKTTCTDSMARGWDISGTNFEDISLQPSIHAVGHWHGFLRNGMLESC